MPQSCEVTYPSPMPPNVSPVNATGFSYWEPFSGVCEMEAPPDSARFDTYHYYGRRASDFPQDPLGPPPGTRCPSPAPFSTDAINNCTSDTMPSRGHFDTSVNFDFENCTPRSRPNTTPVSSPMRPAPLDEIQLAEQCCLPSPSPTTPRKPAAVQRTLLRRAFCCWSNNSV
eukprot:TRINITY_DN16516_c0_g1_i1.p1 TRINITY_DN16516_c0_g1~~TRINITY_DN16516_c0_g1_i1.p1  ORF type:complete len:178 (-),score=4.98 TRINITY_DN16516_c0_g1_i1:127-639(-)